MDRNNGGNTEYCSNCFDDMFEKDRGAFSDPPSDFRNDQRIWNKWTATGDGWWDSDD